MPELPEVETVCRALAPHLEGRTIRGFVAHVDRLRKPVDTEQLGACCTGRRIRCVRRRAKYVIIEQTGARALVIHLGMTGNLRICPRAESVRPHDRVVIALSRGEELRLNDPRRFGSVTSCTLTGPGGDTPECGNYGPEPLEAAFDTDYLHQVTRGRKTPIKNRIMDQSVVVGVGNIYASEALWHARIRPDRPAGKLSRPVCARLVDEIKRTLDAAIKAGGTTIDDYRKPDGSEGLFSRQLQVYGHEGDPCTRCKANTAIRRIVQSGRSSYFCPSCQR